MFQTLSPVIVNGNPITSNRFYPSEAGTYQWVATFSGTPNNQAVAGTCGEIGETTVVRKYTPTLSTNASSPILLGGAINDSATLTGGVSPTGTVAFDLYGPDDASCGAPPIFTTVTPLMSGRCTSASFTPGAVGLYRWVARYSGDQRNNAVVGACGDPNEMVPVTAGFFRAVSFARQSSTVTIVFEGAPRGVYRVQRGRSLGRSDWVTLPGSLTANDEGIFTFSEMGPPPPTFYRAIQ